ncbi:L,D-transpeptidase family protein [Faecalicatena faecalis]|uniref:L,D-transpeptidase family protein n=1 Tax=Faecalicatena faecalis TaxID=2726362 RepID=UPI001FE7B702|nr:L,D-transpeptidase family protein [Faecalicatena faecalis]
MKFDSKINLEKEKCYAIPAFTSDSDLVRQACSQMNQYCEASITYPMNEPVVVDKALISKWLKVDDKMNVMFHDDAVRQWLSEFGDQYDTVGTTRTFTTPTGKSTSVSGGTYGWSIDEDTEFEKLKSSIQNKEVVTREPAYYIGGVAASHAMPDWGNTYVDVDLSEQHMWYLKDGAIVLETDVITGEPIPEKITPEGTFSIQDKKQNEVLVGSIDPSTGKPSYETQVSYWMRITWDTGVGLHDATWQSSFGGTLNQIPDVGSHGCINMPIDQAAALYHMIEVGTPVVVHY